MGMPLKGVDPVPPLNGSFTYSKDELLPNIYCGLFEDLVPPPEATAPEECSYPISPVWNYKEDHCYQSCFIYCSAYNLHELQRHQERLMVTDTPPNIIPTEVDSCFVTTIVPGMVCMIPGIPFVYHINGNP